MFLSEIYKDFREYSSKNSIFLSIVFLLVLIYPLFILSVKHWSSGIYSLLCVISIVFFVRKKNFIYSTEVKTYAWIVFLFFVSILISSTLNDWTYNSYKRLGMEMKILVFVPFFLLLSQYAEVRKWFIYSVPFAGIILGAHGILDVLVFRDPYADSSYGKIITGDISGLLVGLSGVIFIYSKDSILRKICMVAIVVASITCVLSTSRNGWLVLVANISFLLFLSFRKNKKYFLILIIIPIIGVVIANTIINTKGGLDAAVNQFNEYFDKRKFTQSGIAQSSVGIRLEQWRVTLIAFQDQPVFGAGPGNSSIVINDYINKGLAHPDIYNPKAETAMGHVHNQFLDTLLVQGVVGLTLLLLILFYPAWIFFKYYKKNEIYANLGLVLIVSYVISSLTEMPFVSDNYTSIYFLFMAVFLLNVIDMKRKE